jgi:glucokinase
VAKAVVEQYTDYLLVGIQNIIRALQPEAVVLGGAITGQGHVLLEPIKRKQKIAGEIRISPLQNDAGVIGAAAVAIHKL